jgi:D-hexose-6-phosphate mutarotase
VAETIDLELGELTASITTEGAWVKAFNKSGQPIFFPKQLLPAGEVTKERGGCHVCLPNFGPGGDSDQPQHGYGRELTWEVAEKSDSSAKLVLPKGTGEFESLRSQLSYELLPDGLQLQLAVTNQGGAALPLSPGFHPYFATKDVNDVEINGQTYGLDELGEAQFLDGESMELRIADVVYGLQAKGLANWALWSDRLANYVCLEPTADGNSFQEGTAAQIEPGQTAEYAFSIHIGS